MSTYTDAVYSALLAAQQPLSSRALYDQHDTFENAEQVNKAIAYLVKQGRAEMVGTTKPSKSKTVRLYRALTPDEQAERAPSDLDQQLAEAIRERDAETAEAVIEPLAAAETLIGASPDAVEKPCNGLRLIDTSEDPRYDSEDPVIREIAGYREPRIQDGDRLAKHLFAGASVIQDRLPGLATSMREPMHFRSLPHDRTNPN